jgi:hypothetical protein
MKVVARCFLSDTLKAMITLILVVFVLVWAELTMISSKGLCGVISAMSGVIC